MMIAWRVSSLAYLPIVDFPMPPHRCRLVGRGGERAVFVLCCSVVAICPVFVSLFRLLEARFISSASCFEELLPSCLLFAFYHFSSRLASRFSRLGDRLVVPDLPPMCFSRVFFVSFPGVL